MNGMTNEQEAIYTEMIASMTTEELNLRYKLNQQNRWNNLDCLVKKQASLNLEILFDREIKKRAAYLMDDALTIKIEEFGA